MGSDVVRERHIVVSRDEGVGSRRVI
jgi:hypothetical protein